MDIKAIQAALKERGYEVGAVDGIQGPKTINAIKQFQIDNGLVSDGVAGPLTQAKLAAPVTKQMTTSPAGRKLLSVREGNKLKAYQDSIGVWTIGVGHTAAAGLPHPKAGMTITAAESDFILSRDLVQFENGVNKAITVPMSQNEFDALVSLAFNIGLGNFSSSTLVKKMNAGDKTAAADQFLVWNKAGGKVIKGLTTRRKAERAQFLGE